MENAVNFAIMPGPGAAGEPTSALKLLRRSILEEGAAKLPRSMRDCAANMLLYLDEPSEAQRIGLRHLIEVLGCSRADVGFGSINDTTFTVAVAETEAGAEGANLEGTTFPNRDRLFQNAWRSNEVIYLDVDKLQDGERMKAMFAKLGSLTKLSRRLECNGKSFGLLCVEQTERHRTWTGSEQQYLDAFTTSVLSPIMSTLIVSRKGLSGVTDAELKVLKLTAEGLSYKEIGFRLGKSPHTVDNQLSVLRKRFDARNKVELIQACKELLAYVC